jgi:hypothetical protein
LLAASEKNRGLASGLGRRFISFFDRTPCAGTGSAIAGPVRSTIVGWKQAFVRKKKEQDGTGSTQ